MYYELHHFFRRVVFQRTLWKDGEFWTALIFGTGSYIWFFYDHSAIESIRQHLNDLLTTASILFGFAIASLLFYIQAVAAWSKTESVARVADKIVDWHVWTILCLLFLLGYTLGLWSFGRYLTDGMPLSQLLYALLCFQVTYSGLQILNHSLTIWWSFKNRSRLDQPPKPPDSPSSQSGT
jgi:hypothetical protein